MATRDTSSWQKAPICDGSSINCDGLTINLVVPRSTRLRARLLFAAQAAAQSVIEDVRWGAAINHGAIVDRLREGGPLFLVGCVEMSIYASSLE